MIPQIAFYTAQKIEKDWGFELIIDNNKEKNYCGKILHYYKANIKSSAHFHAEKSESMLVTKGKFRVYYWSNAGQKVFRIMYIGDCLQIPAGRIHQIEPLEDNSELFETSTHHDDTDVYRFEPSQKISES